jgi:hypothetical protein
MATFETAFAASQVCNDLSTRYFQESSVTERVKALTGFVTEQLVAHVNFCAESLKEGAANFATKLCGIMQNPNGLKKFNETWAAVDDIPGTSAQIKTILKFIDHVDTEKLFYVFKARCSACA